MDPSIIRFESDGHDATPFQKLSYIASPLTPPNQTHAWAGSVLRAEPKPRRLHAPCRRPCCISGQCSPVARPLQQLPPRRTRWWPWHCPLPCATWSCRARPPFPRPADLASAWMGCSSASRHRQGLELTCVSGPAFAVEGDVSIPLVPSLAMSKRSPPLGLGSDMITVMV